MTDEPKAKKPRGLAAISPEQRHEIAIMGGKAVHKKGVAHEYTSEEAREAGRKGGKTASQDREHMREIGRLGREARKQHSKPTEGKTASGTDAST